MERSIIFHGKTHAISTGPCWSSQTVSLPIMFVIPVFSDLSILNCVIWASEIGRGWTIMPLYEHAWTINILLWWLLDIHQHSYVSSLWHWYQQLFFVCYAYYSSCLSINGISMIRYPIVIIYFYPIYSPYMIIYIYI